MSVFKLSEEQEAELLIRKHQFERTNALASYREFFGDSRRTEEGSLLAVAAKLDEHLAKYPGAEGLATAFVAIIDTLRDKRIDVMSSGTGLIEEGDGEG